MSRYRQRVCGFARGLVLIGTVVAFGVIAAIVIGQLEE